MFDDEGRGGIGLSIGIAVAVPLLIVLPIALLLGLLLLNLTPSASTAGSAAEPTPVPVLAHDGPPPDASAYRWELISDAFDSPVFVTPAGDGSGRLFGVEQGGLIWVIDDGRELPEPFLDLTAEMSPKVSRGEYTEQGLLGLAFHPDFERNGVFFVSYTDPAGDSVLARYQVSRTNPNSADAASAETLLRIDQPFEDHNGGHITFGPDGSLYMGLGDGGNVNEPNFRSQDPALLLGKMLRLDVDDGDPYAVPPDNLFASSSAFAPEIWAWGLRNPWRFSFDRATGDLYIADVGQWAWEEVNFLPAGSPAGANFGWSAFEGTARYLEHPLTEAEVIMPFVTYGHADGCSVTGGYVYRGAAMPELNGYYFYGDYCVGRIWAAWRGADGAWQTALWMQEIRQITSFGEDEQGELYLVDYKGEILRLTR
jgi:glucose/arabinose dehydrogenase